MNCHKDNIETQYIGELPIDTLVDLPDYILTERDIVDQETGNVVRSITRTPTLKIVPNGNYDNITTLEPNNESLEVPEGQVRGAYVKNEGAMNVVHYADTAHQAQFIIVGKLTDSILIQNVGVINIVGTHRYIVGAQYYQGDNGEPTTSSESGQKLFIPISNTKLLINM